MNNFLFSVYDNIVCSHCGNDAKIIVHRVVETQYKQNNFRPSLSLTYGEELLKMQVFAECNSSLCRQHGLQEEITNDIYWTNDGIEKR